MPAKKKNRGKGSKAKNAGHLYQQPDTQGQNQHPPQQGLPPNKRNCDMDNTAPSAKRAKLNNAAKQPSLEVQSSAEQPSPEGRSGFRLVTTHTQLEMAFKIIRESGRNVFSGRDPAEAFHITWNPVPRLILDQGMTAASEQDKSQINETVTLPILPTNDLSHPNLAQKTTTQQAQLVKKLGKEQLARTGKEKIPSAAKPDEKDKSTGKNKTIGENQNGKKNKKKKGQEKNGKLQG